MARREPGADARLDRPPVFFDAAREEDLGALVALERRCYGHPWTAGHFLAALRSTSRALVVAARSARPPVVLGYCVFEVVLDELHVHNLAVDADQRGRGIGRALLALALRLGARRGARKALLEVRPSNWPALHLYRAMGFKGMAVRRDYYSHPREDALVLVKDDLGAPAP
jgi:ribosomal-protein-alanine N-acetyltransferase